MRIQFMSDDEKIIYCDDDILKITHKNEEKKFNVSEIGQVETEKRYIYFYDLNGNCIDSAIINGKNHKSKIEKMKNLINVKNININKQSKNKEKNKYNKKIILFAVFILLFGFFILEQAKESKKVKIQDLENKIKIVSNNYKNSVYEENNYSVDIESESNDNAIDNIYKSFLYLQEYKNIEKVGNIIITAINKDRKLYKLTMTGKQIYSLDLKSIYDYEPKQISKALKIQEINPFIMKWEKVAEFKGTSITTTKSFKITSKNARIKWNTWSDKDYGDFNFICFMYFEDGKIADPYGIANVIGNDKGESIVRTPGTYYFQITTAQGYNIIVEEEVQK